MQNIMIEKIKQSNHQKISYAEFIETALYHPTKGYYMRNQMKIGKSGDFITTSNVSDIFGMIFSKWFLKQVKENNIAPAVCEIGAGNGRFAKAFLDSWSTATDIPLTYNIVESSPYHKQLQQEILPIGKNCYQFNDLIDLKPFNGLIISNELFDALPVHVIEKRNGELFEVMVGWDEKQFVEQRVPLVNPAIQSFIDDQNITLIENQRIEIPLKMESMLNSISNSLGKGLVVTIDYGYTSDEWKSPARKSGSLRGYHKHQMISNVLLHPGEIDITHHIHFDSLIQIGEKYSLEFLLKNRQDEFLIAAGLLKELEDHYDPNPFSERGKRNRAIRSLVMPGMSSFFHVVIQQKGTSLTVDRLF
jgi:SAM-dependent MidA family methyltransferase